MKRISMLTLVVCLFAVPAMASIDAAWTATIDEKRPDRLQVQLTDRPNRSMGMGMRLSELAGLTAAQVSAADMTTVHFQLRREAGSAEFEGTFRNGKGAGQMTFTANRAYITALRSLGVAFDLGHGETREEETLFTLAIHDVSTAFIRSMQAEGFRVPLEKYLALRIFDITPDYVREMRALGIGELDADDLITTRIHKVTPAFVRELATLGYRDLSRDELVTMRIHKVTPQFIRELRDAGYTGIPVEKLVQMRIQKIDAKFLAKMR